jgi:dethiobiotin synthetase
MTLPRGLFVVGTDTGVGKTRVAAAIARGLSAGGYRVGVLKPVASGATVTDGAWHCEDADLLIEAIGGGVAIEHVAPLLFEEPLAPAVAARRLGVPLAFQTLAERTQEALAWWSERADVMIVEGVGGLLTPMAEGASVADLAVLVDYPLVIVARRSLGTLNHTLMTVDCALQRGLRIAGIVLNSPEPSAATLAEETNAMELARLLDQIPILGELGFQDDPARLSIAEDPADWYDRARTRRGEAGLAAQMDRVERGESEEPPDR